MLPVEGWGRSLNPPWPDFLTASWRGYPCHPGPTPKHRGIDLEVLFLSHYPTHKCVLIWAPMVPMTLFRIRYRPLTPQVRWALAHQGLTMPLRSGPGQFLHWSPHWFLGRHQPLLRCLDYWRGRDCPHH